MEIKRISERIFKTPASRIENHENQTNPFGVSFKGNMITADVFETACPKLAEKAANRGKMWVSAIVGSMNDVNEAISKRLNSAMAFGSRVKENALRLGKYLNETKISINLGGADNFFNLKWPQGSHSVKSLMKMDPEAELEDMLKLAIATRG